MMFLNKMSMYSLVTAAGLSLSLSAVPYQVSAINLVGQRVTDDSADNILNFKGQTIDFTVGGSFTGTDKSAVTLNSVKFALESFSTTLVAEPFVAYIFDTTLGLPPFPAVNTGAGALATSDAAVASSPDGS